MALQPFWLGPHGMKAHRALYSSSASPG